MRVRLSPSSTVVTVGLFMFGGCKSVSRSIHRVISSSKHRHTQTCPNTQEPIFKQGLGARLANYMHMLCSQAFILQKTTFKLCKTLSQSSSVMSPWLPQDIILCVPKVTAVPHKYLGTTCKNLSKVWYDQAYLLFLERLDTVVSQLHRIAE